MGLPRERSTKTKKNPLETSRGRYWQEKMTRESYDFGLETEKMTLTQQLMICDITREKMTKTNDDVGLEREKMTTSNDFGHQREKVTGNTIGC